MTVRIVVLAKQVPDPETPPSQFRIDESTNRVIPPNGVPPVVNGFDLNAVEAALKLRDAGTDVEITLALEMFGRARNPEARQKSGTGLGLPLTKGLIEAHGGKLIISSSHGGGTKVTAIFPVERLKF